MIKYIVVLTREETDHDATETLQEEVTVTETDLVLCETDRDVFHALLDADSNTDLNWSVFEVVGTKSVRRAITWQFQDGTKHDLTIG